jgi:hypothetical protein
MTDSGRRLTSWKEIAAYLDRDVRTVMRWEKDRALPVHRGPGGKSGVVFADTAELDAWTRGVTTAPRATGSQAAPPEPAAPSAAAAPPAPIASGRRRIAVAAAVLILIVGAGGWRLRGSRVNESPDSAVFTDAAVIARNADGSEKWRHEFTGERAYPPLSRTDAIEYLGADGILAATSHTVDRKENLAVRSGQVLWLDTAGAIKQSFSFEDRLTIGSRVYAAPWSISDYRLNGSRGERRIAVTAHHYEWWPSIVTILDGQLQRKGSFVHAGWVEHLRWLAEDRLAIAGFSNMKDGAMVALLDANAINGQSPPSDRAEFECAGCGPDRPLRYVIMPRSEVNRVSVAPFNRASMAPRGDTLLARTVELPHTGSTPAATALYEFTPRLELLHASYTDRYWEAHQQLESLGKITHPRARCPERDGPTQIEIWEPATGWRVEPVRRQGVTTTRTLRRSAPLLNTSRNRPRNAAAGSQ